MVCGTRYELLGVVMLVVGVGLLLWGCCGCWWSGSVGGCWRHGWRVVDWDRTCREP